MSEQARMTPKKRITEKAELDAEKLLKGNFTTLEEAKALVAHRKGLLEALDLINAQVETDPLE